MSSVQPSDVIGVLDIQCLFDVAVHHDLGLCHVSNTTVVMTYGDIKEAINVDCPAY